MTTGAVSDLGKSRLRGSVEVEGAVVVGNSRRCPAVGGGERVQGWEEVKSGGGGGSSLWFPDERAWPEPV